MLVIVAKKFGKTRKARPASKKSLKEVIKTRRFDICSSEVTLLWSFIPDNVIHILQLKTIVFVNSENYPK
jgi:hypothetical protein